MNLINTTLVLLLLVVILPLNAQQMQRCMTVEHQHYLNNQFEGYNKAVEKTFQKAKQTAENGLVKEDSILRIPVVVHIVYTSEEQNLPDSVIHNQIQILNEDYRRLNPDADLTRPEFLQVAGDARIEFYLAPIDPDGNASTGIVRKQTSLGSFLDPIGVLLGDLSSLERVKSETDGGSDPWDQDRYLNIWVCDMSAPIIGPVIFGYATPPIGAPNWPPDAIGDLGDGVVVQYQVLGRNNPTLSSLPAPIPDILHKGRTITHEVGHYLGLRHIWGDGGTGLPGSGDCAADDGIEDTPFAFASSPQDCDYSRNSCPDAPIDLPDMIENFMDYADEDCQNVFTNGQIEIMRAMLMGPRAGLLEPLEIMPPVADFEADNTVVLIGTEIQFTDLTTGATDWFWNFGDGNSSIEQNPVHSYTEVGVYTVSLSVSNDVGTDFSIKEDYVTVTSAVGIEANSLSTQIIIAPNPTKGSLNIEWQAVELDSRVEIFDISGKRVVFISPDAALQTVDLSDQLDGLYLVKISTANQVFTQKILLDK